MARPREFDIDQVVDAAMKVFWQRGYAGTSAQDLVEGTGLGRGSLYGAFGSKHNLYERALQRYHEHTASNVALLAEPGPVKDLIRRLLLSIVDTELKDRRGCMAANATLELAGQDEVVAKLVKLNFGRLEGALDGAIRRAQSDGEIPADKNARALARFVVNAIQGLRVVGKATAKSDRQRLIDIVDVTLAAL